VGFSSYLPDHPRPYLLRQRYDVTSALEPDGDSSVSAAAGNLGVCDIACRSKKTSSTQFEYMANANGSRNDSKYIDPQTIRLGA
jgi:hypothetical protein